MWKAMREWEDSIRKPYIRTQKRLMAQIKAAERNAQIERNKTKRAEARLEKARQQTKAEEKRLEAENQRTETIRQKIAECEKEKARLLSLEKDQVILSSIKVATRLNIERSEIIKILMDINGLTRFEAETYLTDFYKSLVPNGINSTQEHQSTPISPA